MRKNNFPYSITRGSNIYSLEYVAGKTKKITMRTLREFIREKLQIPPEEGIELFFPIGPLGCYYRSHLAEVESDDMDLISILLSPGSQGRVFLDR